MSDEQTYSYSQINDWLTCRWRWWAKYVLGIKPETKPYAMDLGIGVHRALAAWFRGEDWQAVLAQWATDLAYTVPLSDPEIEGKLIEIAKSATRITLRAINGIRDMGLQPVATPEGPFVERRLVARVSPVALIEGYLDVLATIGDALWVVDFKIRADLASDISEEASLQNPIYAGLALAHGYGVVGAITYQVSSTPPAIPKLNKDGTMSRAQIATDWTTYAATLLGHGLDPADYEAEMKPKLSLVERVRRSQTPYSAETLTRIWEQIVIPAAHEIGNARAWFTGEATATIPRIPIRNLSPRTCNGCPVRDVCHAHLRGWDAVGLLKANGYSFHSERIAALGT